MFLTVVNDCVMSQMCVCGFYCTKLMCNVTNQCVVFTVLNYCVMSQISAFNCTVEPLLYDHPQNHIGVVV